MTDDGYDAIVVGARVAGCVLAARLADAGARVLLLDKATFPSDTLSTHFFRGAGLVGILAELDVLDEVLAAGAPPLTDQVAYMNGAIPGERSGPQEPGSIDYSLSVRRTTLDPILQARARRAGAEVVTGAKATDLLRAGDRVTGVRFAVGGEPNEVEARWVVGADGRWSVVAAAVDAPQESTDEPIRALYYRYVSGFEPAIEGAVSAEFSFLDDELAYVFPSDGGWTCLALSIPADGFGAFRSDARAAFDAHLAAHVPLAGRYAAAGPGDFHGSHPERGWMRVPWGPGWALVGDAGLHLDPWTGFGMDFAGVHATYLAEAIVAVLGGADEAEAFSIFHRRRNEHALDKYRFTHDQGKDLRPLTAVAG